MGSGSTTRQTGTSLGTVSATTTGLQLLIVALFLQVLQRLTPQRVLPIALPARHYATR